MGILHFLPQSTKNGTGKASTSTYHPSKHSEANATIKGLFPRLAHEYGEDCIKAFFTQRAVISGRKMKFDPATNTVTTEADEALFDLTNVDMDMDIAPQKSVNNIGTFGNHQEVIEKERNDTDSVSTFNSKRAPPAEIITLVNKKAKKTKDDSSSHQQLRVSPLQQKTLLVHSAIEFRRSKLLWTESIPNSTSLSKI